jgi:hypothetical protein
MFLLGRTKLRKEEPQSSGVKKEHESTDVRAHKMMKGKVEPFEVLTMVQAVPTIV